MNDPDRRHTSDGFDHDAMFADIVAHWSEAGIEPTPVQTPSTGDVPGDKDPGAKGPGAEVPRGEGPTTGRRPAPNQPWPTDPPPVSPPALAPPTEPRAIPAPEAWRAHEVGDYEEHFEPPAIAPLPVGDLQFWAIIAGMVGGPLLLLYLVLFNRDAGSYWMLTAIAMSVGGFALLVARLPRDHEDDDDGARL